MILPFDQAKAVARGATSILYLPVSRARRPKTGRRELVQSHGYKGRFTHCHVIVGVWETTTMRPLLKPAAVKDRHQAGWQLGGGIVQMCDEWMRRFDRGWQQMDGEVTEQQVVDRFEKRHADRLVYALIVTVDREEVRIPTPAGRPRGDELGYSRNPADDLLEIAEAVPVKYQDDKISAPARARDEVRRLDRGEGKDARWLRLIDRQGDRAA